MNADDFGRTEGITRGIVRAHDDGIVTSTSLMVRWDAAPLAVSLAAERPKLSLGLHLDMGEWTYSDGAWRDVYTVVDANDRDAVSREAREQLERFRALVGRDPTHIDSHQHVHQSGPVGAVARFIAAELGVPVRHHDPRVAYCGDFYGRGEHGEPLDGVLSAEHLIEVIEGLEPGVTELGCHPGERADDDPHYADERPRELAALTDPRVARTVERLGVKLISFRELR